jgi:hypothetical protein
LTAIEAVRRNGQRKLTGTWCNTISAGVYSVGALAPTTALLFGVKETTSNVNAVGWVIIVSVIMGTIIHLAGRRGLARLEE